MDYQQPRGYVRPPPTAADPYQRAPPPLPPPPPNNEPWPYSGTQFQYQNQTQQYPSYPPPPQPPHTPYPPHQQMHYSTHQSPLYPAQHPSYPHYPQPHQLPPRPLAYSQDWGTANRNHQQSWHYTNTANNEEDWAAKARAWAAAKVAMDNHVDQSHFTTARSNGDQNHFHDQYPQSLDPQYHVMHKPLYPTSNYQQYTTAAVPLTRTGMQDPQNISSDGAGDIHVPSSAGNDNLTGDSASLAHQEKSSIAPIVHRQEVPSSYSSVAGNEETGETIEKFNSSSSLSGASHAQYHVQPPQSAAGRPGWVEEHREVFGNPPESVADLSDQPLNFAPNFNHVRDPQVLPGHNHSSGGPLRGADPALPISSNHAWPSSSAPVSAYGPVPLPVPSGPQGAHPISMPPPSGHSAFPIGPVFQPNDPLIGPTFGGSSGAALHPASFSGDAYGFLERPKKASVPNWLREEIIKNKVVLANSGPEIPNDDSQSIEEDGNDRSPWNSDQPDSKNIDSTRSVEDEDEDEDEVEAARTAAINQEIKRVLTEVLLKVTDELFDEIATKVLKEDDHAAEAGLDIDSSKHQMLHSAPSILTPKASAKVLLPAKTRGSDGDDGSEDSTSGSPRDILGLGNYASDEEEDSEIKSSSEQNQKVGYDYQQSSDKLPESRQVIENGGYSEESHGQRGNWTELDTKASGQKSPHHANTDRSSGKPKPDDSMAATDDQSSGKITNSVIEMPAGDNGRPDGNVGTVKSNDASGTKITAKPYHGYDDHENRRNLVKKEHRDSESLKEEIGRRHEKTERANYNDNSKDKGKEKGRADDQVKSSGSRRPQSAYGFNEEMAGMRREKINSDREDVYERRRDREADENKERTRHKSGSETSRYKRERSSSVGDRGRASKDSSMANHANDSSDDSHYSKRILHHSNRRKSPSPVKTRKRHVSPSTHSKHSKRRHSPYSYLETTRRRRSPSRSRSRSPARRRR